MCECIFYIELEGLKLSIALKLIIKTALNRGSYKTSNLTHKNTDTTVQYITSEQLANDFKLQSCSHWENVYTYDTCTGLDIYQHNINIKIQLFYESTKCTNVVLKDCEFNFTQQIQIYGFSYHTLLHLFLCKNI